MNAEKKKKRIFGAAILLLMTILALGTVGLASGNGWATSSSSYSLLIEKVFADKYMDGNNQEITIPETVLNAAKEKTYTFLINGTRTDSNNQKIPVNDRITLSAANNWKTTLYSEGPFQVTVTELTDDVPISVDGKDYNMADTVCETDALLQGPEPQKLQLKNNAKITIKRPAQITDSNGNVIKTLKTTSWFHIYNEPFSEHDPLLKPMDEIIALKPGEAAKTFEGLSAGIYTIEELKAPDGYSIFVGPRSEDVKPDKNGDASGSFYINGTPGKLTITAGGKSGDGTTHYYAILRTDIDDIKFEPRMVRIDSGGQYTLDNLPKGNYTVTESAIDGKSGYTLTVPKQKLLRTTTGKSSALSTTDGRNWKTFTIKDQNVNYVNITKFGPLLNASDEPLPYSYNGSYASLYFGIPNNNNLVERLGYFGGSHKAGGTYTTNKDIILNQNNKGLSFAVTGVNAPDAKKLSITWKEYTAIPDTTVWNGEFESTNTKEVDFGGYMIFNKAADNTPGAENLTYHYTISATGKSFTNCTVTDINDNPLSNGSSILKTDTHSAELIIKPGQNIKLNGLEMGTYSITETVGTNHAAGFTMDIVGCPINITEPDKTSEITVHGTRTLKITKHKCLDGTMDDKDREYTFEVLQNNNVVGNLTLKDGESGEITINAGDYEVKPTNETPEPFHMTYTDSASVNGPAEGNPSAAIKFSNVFTAGDGGYRYIHEYYFKDKDGKYRYEGSSDMTYVRGRPLTESYQSLDIDLKPFFSINGSSYEYTHFGDGYGIVDVGDSRNKAPGTYADLSADTTEETDEDGTTTTASETEDEEETDTGEETDTTESSPGSTDQTDESDGETPSQTDTAETETETQTLTNPGESEVENPSQPAGTEAGEKDQSQSDAGESEPKDQPQTIPLETAEENRTQDAHREFMEENGAAADAQSPDPGMHLFAHTAVTEIDRQTSTDTGETTAETEPQPTATPAESESDHTQSAPAEDETISSMPATDDDTDGEETTTPTMEEPSETEQEPSEEETVPSEAETDTSGEETNTSKEETEPFTDMSETSEESITASLGETGSPARARTRVNTAKATVTDKDGILTTGNGVGSDSITRSYTVDPDMNHAKVTENGSNVIILRYYREIPEKDQGSYKVIHVYYLRDKDGDKREGISDVINMNGQNGHSYTADGVPLITAPTNFDVDGKHYTYTHDQRPQYGLLLPGNAQSTGNPLDGYINDNQFYRPDTSWTSVNATQSGNQIIILRYYRELTGSYNIVHEYYYRELNKSTGEETGAPDENEAEGGVETEEETDSDTRTVKAKSRTAASSRQTGGTLTSNAQYTYTFEGARTVERIRAPLGSIHQGDENSWIPDYGSRRYAYHSVVYGELDGNGNYRSIPDRQWAVSTEDGQQIIILRYYREDTRTDTPDPPPETPPEEPENPETTPEHSGETEPSETLPEVPETPSRETETETTTETETSTDDPENPGYPTELPDPNDPDSPDRITIWEDGVPKTYIKIWDPEKGEYVYILDEDTPLAPMTGDDSQTALWLALMLASLTASGVLYATRTCKKAGIKQISEHNNS